jgi:hypothetical protein
MIISASRRTDIPAFYAEWLSRRLQEGYCTVPNPFHHKQVTRISLKPEDVDALVFWTRNPRPLLPYLKEFDSQGFRYYFQFTILNYPREIDPKLPPVESIIESFQLLSQRLGSARMVWRYDPVVITRRMSPSFHQDNFHFLAETLRGYTHRSVVSLVDLYRKIEGRLRTLAGSPDEVQPCLPEHLAGLMPNLVRLAGANGMSITSCAEETDLIPFGIRPGKCIDDDLLHQAFGIQLTATKDPGQRPACQCVLSKDIGMYDTCLHGCLYCYATGGYDRALRHFRRHDPLGSSLFA